MQFFEEAIERAAASRREKAARSDDPLHRPGLYSMRTVLKMSIICRSSSVACHDARSASGSATSVMPASQRSSEVKVVGYFLFDTRYFEDSSGNLFVNHIRRRIRWDCRSRRGKRIATPSDRALSR